MKFSRTTFLIIAIAIIMSAGLLHAERVNPSSGTKKLDLTKYHNVGNIWLRVSNYGFFGSGSDLTPPWPSLEYPGGSGVDYLYQGALWFGAKKYRKSVDNRQYYWKVFPPTSDNNDVIFKEDPAWETSSKVPVIDTLVTVGFDGDNGLYEFLPAYNPLEYSVSNYAIYNPNDQVATASVRTHRRAFDDDGDGNIDEDPVGYAFPFRKSNELPPEFASFGYDQPGSGYLQNIPDHVDVITNNVGIWFPLGFTDLSFDGEGASRFNFAYPSDDDGDGLIDEDGAPVSEQDYISYYYDYSPFKSFGDLTQRDYGRDATQNDHVPLNIRVRQMSYQWSYEYIKNLVYVEFDITNMNPRDTLFDCAMGIYMDSDVGPQAWGSEKAEDDKSGYISGTGAEFAFTYDADRDNGQTPGVVGSRVCSPDPEGDIEYTCWYWKVGDGPDDEKPLKYWGITPRKTANEKYWLLTGRNPNNNFFDQLRIPAQNEGESFTNQQAEPNDTRYLFAFYGNQNGISAPSDSASWNLAPKKTMKIVIAVFPGDYSDSFDDLKESARWAKTVYGKPQSLKTVVFPDIESHYNPPEPPTIPKSYVEMRNNANKKTDLHVYWDNGSELTHDLITVGREQIGWNSRSNFDSDSTNVNMDLIPEQFRNIPNQLAIVNPFTAWRLRHDFQGYSIWQREKSGLNDQWRLVQKWDKIDTDKDWSDYAVNNTNPGFIDFGGDTGIDKGLPNETIVDSTNVEQWNKYYKDYYILDENYFKKRIQHGDVVSGKPLYNRLTSTEAIALIPNYFTLSLPLSEQQIKEQALLFKHEDLSDKMFLELFDDSLIPLRGHLGQSNLNSDNVEKIDSRKDRLFRKYYYHVIPNVPQGYEHYCSVTAWDRGMPSKDLQALESGKDANMKVFFPGPASSTNMDNIYVVPNPYRSASQFDGRRDKDTKGDKSRRIWFVNLPEKCNIQIYTLAGDLVDEFEHNGEHLVDIITISKAATQGLASSGIHEWNLLTKNNQILASGVYLFSVKDHATGDVKVGKFAVIR